jgi:L-lactate dehydrogenase complex protein LldG
MESLFETFKVRAEAASAEVHRFATQRETFEFIHNLLLEQGIRDEGPGALWADSTGKGFDQRYEGPGVCHAITRQAAAEARVGISQADWAVAATGTLVVDATQVEQRLVSTLPPIHVALVATSRLRADLPTVLAQLHPSQAGYISLITGPSRTADIERVLTIGVHGPGRLIILFVDELERGNA